MKIFSYQANNSLCSIYPLQVYGNFSSCSSVLNPGHQLKMECAENLPGLSLRMKNGHLVEPCLQEYSPFGVIIAVMRVLYVVSQIHKGLPEKVCNSKQKQVIWL